MSIRADAIVIGGGVVGLATALALRQAGLTVVIVERGVCGGEASWAGAGILSPANPHRHDLVQELQTAALDRYPSYCQSLTDATGDAGARILSRTPSCGNPFPRQTKGVK